MLTEAISCDSASIFIVSLVVSRTLSVYIKNKTADDDDDDDDDRAIGRFRKNRGRVIDFNARRDPHDHLV